MASRKIVIIGGVAAGPKAAARAHRMDPEADITIVERDSMVSYAGCGMPFYLSGEVSKFEELFETTYGVVRDADYFWREKGCKLYTRTEAKSIDRENKEVTVENLDTGEQFKLPYDKLVIATGGSPVTPPIEGLDLKGVHRLNHPSDVQAIKQSLEEIEADEAIVIGAGLIGLEAVDALSKQHLFTTVVELQDQVLPAMLDPDMAEWMQKKLEDSDVEIRLGQKVLRIEGDEEGKVSKVVTDQEELEGQIVIMAVGVRPNVELAKQAGLEIGKTGAIAVNEYQQTSDPDIYALGDCVENTNILTGEKNYVPLASTANRQGRVAGTNVTGGSKKFEGILGTAVMHTMGYNVGRTGLSEKQARDAGYKVATALNNSFDRTHYHPGNGLMMLKYIYDEDTGRLLGAQAQGEGDVVKRIDVAATAITFGASVTQLSNLDLGYAPPFSTPIDVAQHTANIADNKMNGIAQTITAQELKNKMDSKEDFVILDVRLEEQFRMRRLKDDRVMLVVLSDLRDRIEEIPRDKEIVVVCALGTRSYDALRTLKGAGFEDVKYLEAGLQGWPYNL